MVDIRLLIELISVTIEIFLEKMAPIIDEPNEYEDNPRELTETENSTAR